MVVCRSSSVVRRLSSVVWRLVLVFLALVIVASAQEYRDLHGTWINAKFIEELKRTASVAAAMEAVSATAPLWVRIDSADQDGNVDVAFDLSSQKQMVLLKAQLIGPELRWGLGDAVGPIWLVTADQEQGTFLALHVLDSMGNVPKVLGKLPSRNQDPDFLIDRMINASVLAGKYVDDRKRSVVFNTDMTATWAGKSYQVRIDVKEGSHQLLVTLTATDGTSNVHSVQRIGSDLVFVGSDGKTTTLKKHK